LDEEKNGKEITGESLMKPVVFIYLLVLFGWSFFGVFTAYNKGIIPFILSVCGTAIFLFLLLAYAKSSEFRLRNSD